MQRVLIAVVTCLAAIGCAANPPIGSRPLTRDEAIQVAEAFVRRNGYTDYRPGPDQVLDSNELFDEARPREEILDSRANTLEASAVGAIPVGRTGLEAGWTVAFERRKTLWQRLLGARRDERGRVVTMNSDGTNVEMAHMDFRLEAVSHE